MYRPPTICMNTIVAGYASSIYDRPNAAISMATTDPRFIPNVDTTPALAPYRKLYDTTYMTLGPGVIATKKDKTKKLSNSILVIPK